MTITPLLACSPGRCLRLWQLRQDRPPLALACNLCLPHSPHSVIAASHPPPPQGRISFFSRSLCLVTSSPCQDLRQADTAAYLYRSRLLYDATSRCAWASRAQLCTYVRNVRNGVVSVGLPRCLLCVRSTLGCIRREEGLPGFLCQFGQSLIPNGLRQRCEHLCVRRRRISANARRPKGESNKTPPMFAPTSNESGCVRWMQCTKPLKSTPESQIRRFTSRGRSWITTRAGSHKGRCAV